MKSSYKIALLVAIAVLGFVVFHYATQPEGSVDVDGASQTDTDVASTPAPAQTTASSDSPESRRPTPPAPPSRTAVTRNSPASTSTNEQDKPERSALMDMILHNQRQARGDNTTASSTSDTDSGTTPTENSPTTSSTVTESNTSTGAEPETNTRFTPRTFTLDGEPDAATTTDEPTASTSDDASRTSRSTSEPTWSWSNRNREANASATTSTNNAATRPSRSPATESTSNSQQKSYTIQPGDTFSSIAIDVYGNEARWVDIAQANPQIDPVRLKVGQEIRLPDAATRQEMQPAASTATASGNAEVYTVQPLDTLSGLAARFYDDPGKWRIIYNANREVLGSNPDRIPADVQIVIPSDSD